MDRKLYKLNVYIYDLWVNIVRKDVDKYEAKIKQTDILEKVKEILDKKNKIGWSEVVLNFSRNRCGLE